MQQLPTYEQVQAETTGAMQRIVDQLPTESFVEDLTVPTPYGCSGDGVMYTGHWEVHVPEGFDTAAFVEQLPGLVTEHFAEEEIQVPHSFPKVALRATDGSNVSMDVSNIDPVKFPKVNLLAISRCAQDPDANE